MHNEKTIIHACICRQIDNVHFHIEKNKTLLNRDTAAIQTLLISHEKVANPLHPFFLSGSLKVKIKERMVNVFFTNEK